MDVIIQLIKIIFERSWFFIIILLALLFVYICNYISYKLFGRWGPMFAYTGNIFGPLDRFVNKIKTLFSKKS